jgi:hypothetical protein
MLPIAASAAQADLHRSLYENEDNINACGRAGDRTGHRLVLVWLRQH